MFPSPEKILSNSSLSDQCKQKLSFFNNPFFLKQLQIKIKTTPNENSGS